MFFLPLLNGNSIKAQFYNGSQMKFGKNRLQFNEALWLNYRLPKFDIYYYQGGSELAVYIALSANKFIEEIEDKFNFTLEDKIQFIVYKSMSDLKESNIGLISDEHYNIGGVTYIVGEKVFIYFDGNHKNLEKQVKAGISQAVFNQLLYGNHIGSKIKNSTLISLPNWYTQGLMSYMSEEWSTEIDNYVRDGILSGKYKKFNSLTGDDAIYAGHSIWYYIGTKYGAKAISNILYMTKYSRSVESGFLYGIGISFKSVSKDWLAFCHEKNDYLDSSSIAQNKTLLLKKIKKNRVYGKMKISPDGNFVAFTTNELGQYKVWLYNTNTHKVKRILKRKQKLEEKTDYSFPLLAWHPTGELLSIVTESKGKLNFYNYTLKEKSFEKKDFTYFSKILSFSYAPNGKLIVFSAVQRGQSDIFVYNVVSGTYFQATKDIYDDLYPCFINNSSDIVFSSNRNNDTLKFDNPRGLLVNDKQLDLFIYNYSTKNNVLKKVTHTPFANETNAVEYDKQFFSYLSDQNGINNRYVSRIDSVISFVDTTTHYRDVISSFPLTDYPRNILEQDISFKTGKIGEVVYEKGLYKMYYDDLIASNNLITVEPKNTFFVESLIKSKQKKLNNSETDSIKKKKKKIINVHNEQNDNNLEINDYSSGKISTLNDILTKNDSIKSKRDSILKSINENPLMFMANSLGNYHVEYSISQMVTQIDFSYLNSSYQPFTYGLTPVFVNPGFGGFIKVGLEDLLENYRITGALKLSPTLRNNEYLISFENLKNRLDKQIIFHRKGFENADYSSVLRQQTHEVFYILKWPFNPVACVRGTLNLKNEHYVFMSTDMRNLLEPNVNKNWLGVKGEFIFDNTRNKGLNLYYGTRLKLFAEYYKQLDVKKKDFTVLGIDIRNYQKISKTFIWANRIAASTSFGHQKLVYYMGGVDNWIKFNNEPPMFNTETPIATDQNYAYQTLATNMRGFNQNIRNGNSFAVINSELRFPVFKYFFNRPLKSDLISNFQLIGYGDIGTAWTGKSPYSENNSLFNRTIVRGPIVMRVQYQINPIVGGYGFGFRTRLLGYFLRFDWAWGVNEGYVTPRIFYFSLGLDF